MAIERRLRPIGRNWPHSRKRLGRFGMGPRRKMIIAAGESLHAGRCNGGRGHRVLSFADRRSALIMPPIWRCWSSV